MAFKYDSVNHANIDGYGTYWNNSLDPLNDKVSAKPYGVSYSNLTASALVRTGATIVVGVFVNSTTGGTLKLWDNTAGSGTVVNNTITFASAGYYPLGNALTATGLYATIGGTLDCTIYYADPTSQS